MGTDLLNKHSCPSCGYPVDATTGLLDSEHPDRGALSICVRCLNLGIFETFAGHVALRPITEAEEAAVRADPKWAATFKRLDLVRASQPGSGAARAAAVE